MWIHLPVPRLKINENRLPIDVLVRLHANPFATPSARNQWKSFKNRCFGKTACESIHHSIPKLEINENPFKIDVFVRCYAIHLPLPKLLINEHRWRNDVFVKCCANPFTIPEARNQRESVKNGSFCKILCESIYHSRGSKPMKIIPISMFL